MDCGVMTFGRHRGLPTCDIEISYLLWAVDTMSSPPQCVVDELERRAKQQGSRDAVSAASALASLTYRSARREKVRQKQFKKRQRQSRRSKDKVERIKGGTTIKGDSFDKQRSEWESKGGDMKSCPFD